MNKLFLSLLVMVFGTVLSQIALCYPSVTSANTNTADAAYLSFESTQILDQPDLDYGAISHFGKSVAIFEGSLVVADPNQRKVYVYSKVDSNWQLTHTINDEVLNSQFGKKVMINHHYLVISDAKGNVYIYQKQNDHWEYLQTISSPFEGHGDFGANLALNDDTLVISANQYHGGTPIIPPSIYIYEKTEGVWLQTQVIHSDVPEPQTNDWGNVILSSTTFGTSLALKDSVLIIGDPLREIDGSSKKIEALGAVSVFVRRNNQWELVQKINSPFSYYTAFGESVALHNDTLAIAASNANAIGDDLPEGTVFIFDLNSDQHWLMTGRLSPGQTVGLTGSFGKNILFFNDTLVVADPYSGHFSYGNVYGFSRLSNSSQWLQSNDLHLAESYFNFGYNLATDGSELVITPNPELSSDNKVFIFSPKQ